MFVTIGRVARRVLVAVLAVSGAVVSPLATVSAAETPASQFELAPALPAATSLRDITNSYRASAGVAGLTLSAGLNSAAQIRAREMAANGYFGHQRPDGRSPGTVLAQVGYGWIAWGENLYMSSNDPAPSSVVAAWMNSSGHRSSMLSSNFTQVGFGSASTSNFAGRGPRTIVVAIYARPSGVVLVAPSAPQSFAASSPAAGQVRLTWAAPASSGGAAITGYNYQRSADGGRTWSTAASVFSPSTRSAVLRGLTPGAVYHFRIRARNSVGWGTLTGAVAVRAKATQPSAPPALRATAQSTGQVRLDWTTPGSDGGSAINGYGYQRSADGGRTWSTASTVFSPSARSVVLSGLTPGATYLFRVRARNAVGWGVTSPPASVRTVAAAVPTASAASAAVETTEVPTTTTAPLSVAPSTAPATTVGVTAPPTSPTSTVPASIEPPATAPSSTEPESTSTEAAPTSTATPGGS